MYSCDILKPNIECAKSKINEIEGNHRTYIKSLALSEALIDYRKNAINNFFTNEYLTILTSTTLTSEDKVQVHKLHLLLYNILYYTQREDLLTFIEATTFYKLNRTKFPITLIVKLHEAYMYIRNFDKANKLLLSYENLEHINKIKATYAFELNSRRNGIAYDHKKSDIYIKPINLSFSPHIVITASPACKFSQNFFNWLSKDKALISQLNEHITVLIPPAFSHSLPDLNTYKELGLKNIFIVHKKEEWEEITSWSTPSFYIFKEQKFTGNFDGWNSVSEKKLNKFIELIL